MTVKRIALTGGIACGKSLVAKYLNELGVETIDADDIVHALIPDPVERKRLAAEVFADPGKRRALEARLHPLVKERIGRFFDSSIRRFVDCNEPLDHLKISDDALTDSSNESMSQSFKSIEKSINRRIEKFSVAIIPLLFETHWDTEYDIICCVASDRVTQVSRMTATRGYTREEAEARLAAQLPVEEKAAKSHYVIENNGSSAELKKKVAKFVDWLKEENRRIVKSIESSDGGRAAVAADQFSQVARKTLPRLADQKSAEAGSHPLLQDDRARSAASIIR